MKTGNRTAGDVVFNFIRDNGAATCDEIEASTGLSHQTAGARIRELREAGKIRTTGDRRETRSGRTAQVYAAR